MIFDPKKDDFETINRAKFTKEMEDSSDTKGTTASETIPERPLDAASEVNVGPDGDNKENENDNDSLMKGAAEVADEDLEDGEIEDDDEEEEEQISKNQLANDSNAESEGQHSSSHSSKNKSNSDRDGKSSERSRDRDRHKKRKKNKRSDLDADEEKKRKLGEKLAALEKQMAVEDEVMGIYTSGGSPTHQKYTDEESESEGEDGASSISSQHSKSQSPSRGTDPARRKRKRRDSRDEKERKRRRDDRHRRREGNNNANKEKSTDLCKLFMQGKCPKSPENCMYSHDAEPPKIMELCKFYLFERCAKKEKCLYLHKGFPCKYYHTGTRCMDTKESCKFSHEDLTPETRAILLKHLEMAPKEILGDFPRMTREKAVQVVARTEAKHNGIPFDQVPELQNTVVSSQDQTPTTCNNAPPAISQSNNNANTVPIGEKRRRSRWEDGQSEMPHPPGILLPPQMRLGDGFMPPGAVGGPPRGGSDMPFMSPHMMRGPSILGPRPHPPFGLLGVPPADPFRMRPPFPVPPMSQMPPMFNQQQQPPLIGTGDMGGFPPNNNVPPPSIGKAPPLVREPSKVFEKESGSEREAESDNQVSVKKFSEPLPQKEKEENQEEEKPFRLSENWCSSDEDESEAKSRNSKANNETQQPLSTQGNNVTLPKELTDVLSAIKKDSSSTSPSNSKPTIRDPRKSRDPRAALASSATLSGGDTTPTSSSTRDPRSKFPANIPSEREKDKRLMEMDLGSVFGDLELPTFKDSTSPDDKDSVQDPMGLPFKPYVVNAVAKEIDASIYSHSPLDYKLRPVVVGSPDYADIIVLQHIPPAQVQQDPRLRRYAKEVTSDRKRLDSTGAYSPTQQTFDLQRKIGTEPEELSYNPHTDLNKDKPEQKIRRRDPRRRD